MHKSHDLGIRVFFDRGFEFFGIDWIAPAIHHHHGCGTTALDVFLHSPAKNTVLTHNDLIATLEQVHEGGFHAGRTRRR